MCKLLCLIATRGENAAAADKTTWFPSPTLQVASLHLLDKVLQGNATQPFLRKTPGTFSYLELMRQQRILCVIRGEDVS